MPRKETLKHFKGLNNRREVLGGGSGWLRQADNINVRSDATLERRDGYLRVFAGAITSSYATLDHTRMYAIDGGDLKLINPDFSAVTLRSGLATAPLMHWSEVNNQVFFSNGVDSGILLPGGEVIDWAWPEPAVPQLVALSGQLAAGLYRVLCTFVLPDGRETGSCPTAAVIALQADSSLQISGIPQEAGLTTRVYIAPADSTVFQLAFETSNTAELWNTSPDSLGVALTTYGLASRQPNWGVHQYWRGNIYTAEFLAQDDATAIFSTEALGFHLFNVSEKGFLVPGECIALIPHELGLIIGTKTQIYSFDGEKLTKLANYGVVRNNCWAFDDDDNSVFFWTARGVCRGLPFENLTDVNLSVPPGKAGGCSIIRTRGDKRFVVSLGEQGVAENQRFNL